MNLLFRCSALIALLTVPALTFAADLTGFWKMGDQPAWIEIHAEGDKLIGTVRRNDTNPDAVGRVLLKDLTDQGDGAWKGQIFAARLNEYRDADIELVEESHMRIEISIGFMSRTIDCTRVTEIP